MASLARQLLGVAVVTGAGGTGIGAAVAKGFARSGCTRIAITDINPKTLSQTKEAILSINSSVKILDRPGDIADENFIDSFHDEVLKKFARLDYAVNCAGILGSKTLKAVEMETDAFDRLNGINYPAYCASKSAIINMTKANAIDYSENGIRVNCVCPGVIETPMTTTSPEMVEALKPAINIAPMQRMGTPDEVANAVLFLCSSQASFIQGHALVVDGGYTIN
ncbi:hypothetical protein N0V90_009137 [Kalmusia sp. IMI 367209]|nr:hypothetical protein N0V90_009137 [Kalmusia sp. IMI 367209]